MATGMNGNVLALLWVIMCGVLAAALTDLLSKKNPLLYWLDEPNGRSLHQHPTPRTGGVAVLFSVAVALIVNVAANLRADVMPPLVWLAVALLALIGLLDDRRSLPVRVRLPVQMLAFALMLYGLREHLQHWWPLWALPVLWLAGLWFLNLYNFMDGMDGFAGSMTVVGAAALAVHAYLQHHAAVWPALLLMFAASGFLLFNWPKAKIFLGDAGAYGISALLFALLLLLCSDAVITLAQALLIFLPFWADATVTLLKRAWRRERIWEAHRTHYYQRAVQAGMPVNLVLRFELADMLLMAGLSVLLIQQPVWLHWLALALALAAHVSVFRWLSLRWRADATSATPLWQELR